jgi:L-serine deaminase
LKRGFRGTQLIAPIAGDVFRAEAAGSLTFRGAHTHAATITFQNTMGLVCDLVQGLVEIPCTTRNAVAAASAFVNADLILGGYVNPIPNCCAKGCCS